MDTELTGLDVKKDSIVSMGAVGMQGRQDPPGRHLLRDGQPGDGVEIRKRRGPRDHAVGRMQKSGHIGSVIEDLLKFCAGAVVVGHFLSLDLGFLNKEMKRLHDGKFPQPACRHPADTRMDAGPQQEVQRSVRACEENKDLFSLAKKYHIPVSAAHNALMDAFITAQLFQRFLSSLPGARRQDREGPAADRKTLRGGGEEKKHLQCKVRGSRM